MIGIDLFAGAGGMSLGAKYAGVDVQVVVEADHHAATTYLENHPPTLHFHKGDIREFKKVNLENPNAQKVVLFGGPPCQGFSTSNQKTRNSENPNNWLFKEFLRVIKLYTPSWVVFENVKGILETENGKFAKQVQQDLEAVGYTCKSKVLRASSFGIPQHRDRFFIVANLLDLDFEFPQELNITTTVSDAFADLPALNNGASQCVLPYKKGAHSSYAELMRKNTNGVCSNHLVTRNASHVLERYSHIPEGGNWENIPDQLMSSYKDKSRCHTGIYKRLKNNAPSVVIGNYRKNMLIHPNEDRGLSVREAARLQSFPDDFKFFGSIGFQQQQVGNAVPPLLAEKVFEQIMKY